MLASHTTSQNIFLPAAGGAEEKTNMDCFGGLWRPLGTDTKQRCCASSRLCSGLWASSQAGTLPREGECGLDSAQNQFHKVNFSLQCKVFANIWYYQLRNARIQTTDCVPALWESYFKETSNTANALYLLWPRKGSTPCSALGICMRCQIHQVLIKDFTLIFNSLKN